MKFFAKLGALLACITLAPHASAYDFIDNGIAYRYNADRSAVSVTYTALLSTDNYSDLKVAIIPTQATPDGINYLTVESVDDFAFCGCQSLESVTLPSTMQRLGDRALAYCPALTSITVDDGNRVYSSRYSSNAVMRLSDYTIVAGCSASQLGNIARRIGAHAFAGCAVLTDITIPATVTSIGYEAFVDCPSLAAITIPYSVNELGYRVFAGCDALEEIVVSAGNARYDSRDECNGVVETATSTLVAGCKATVLPATVTSIGYEAFSGVAMLNSLDITEPVTTIGHYALRDMPDLTSVDIAGTVDSFGDRALAGCTNLRSITSHIERPNEAEYYDLSTFFGVDTVLCTVYVPEGTVDTYVATMPWTPFFHIEEIPKFLLGDVNNDGVVDINDLNILVNIVLGFDDASNYDRRAYITDDDIIDISDINALVTITLNSGS